VRFLSLRAGYAAIVTSAVSTLLLGRFSAHAPGSRDLVDIPFESRLTIPRILRRWVAKRDSHSAIVSVPATPCAEFDAVAARAQVDLDTDDGRWAAREAQPGVGDYSIASTPLTFGAEQRRLASVPPRLGEHTDEILTDLLEMSAVEVAALRSQGVVGERAAH
jgi:crotonobetainyl-CoA:carnitine CoA-transferase CaiB-like acyl-CoA transferase